MKILALEPYYGGSHKSFLEGWIGRSEHQWELLTLPDNKWKWRMRMAAITFADQVSRLIAEGHSWDVLFCSDMLNLAEFLGLVDKRVRDIPSIVYFHENQLTYPYRFESERDYQFVATNMTTALAADFAWFNTKFHKNEFITELPRFIKKAPNERPTDILERIEAKSTVQHPGIDVPLFENFARPDGPLRILWAARWEHDKNPEDFFAAMRILKNKGVDFRLRVIGQQFREIPKVFEMAKKEFAAMIEHWGFQPTLDDYLKVLQGSDIVVSTAIHEFFGISIVEAIVAGAYPLLPDRLAYPEIVNEIEQLEPCQFLYGGTPEKLAQKLEELANRNKNNNLWQNKPKRGKLAMQKFNWTQRAEEMDKAIAEV